MRSAPKDIPTPASGARPAMAVTIGDPGGIGPEVAVRALAARARREPFRYVVFGSGEAMHAAAELCAVEPFWWRVEHGSALLDTTSAHDVVLVDYDRLVREAGAEPRFRPEPGRLGGELSFRFVEDAIRAASLPEGDPRRVEGIVTGPISKEAWARAGHGRYPGHTELLATRFRVKRCAMMFEGPSLRVVLATTHIPLMDIRNALTIGRVCDAIDLGAEGCRRLGVERPRIAVCGLNPHAGEGGLLGDEEERLIMPAIEIARRHGLDVGGPLPGDSVFGAAVAGRYDLVVAMYHDQGLIPIKLLARDRSVNITVGLPTVRTSPDHGTAFDIAGRGTAEAGSMSAAIDVASRMIVPTGRRAKSSA